MDINVQQQEKYSIKGNRIALVRNALDLIGDYKGKLGELAIEDFVKENELTKIVNIPTHMVWIYCIGMCLW